MRKLWFLPMALWALPCFAAPDSTLSVTPTAVAGTTIAAADENDRNNDITTWANAHDHNDIDQLANTTNLGDGTAGNKTLCGNAADSADRCLRWDDTNDVWVLQQGSSTYNTIQSVSSTAPIATNTIVTAAGLGLLQSGTTTIYTTSPITTLGNMSVRVYNNAALGVASGTATVLTFNTERFDSDTMHSTVATTGRLTATTAGNYLITGTVEWAAGSNQGTRRLDIYLNGATVIASNDTRPNPDQAAVTRQTITTYYQLAAAEYVELRAYQTGASSINVNVSGNYSPEFSMVKAP